jgi:PAS domain S-box-containing protein
MSKEILINQTQMITSATDIKRKIIYVNDVFCKIAGYKRAELIGKPHNIIRHPNMPKVVFKLLWDTILSGKSIYAFVINKANNGDFYWVKAHVKPILKNGEIVKIISYRKPVNDFAKEVVSQIYATLVEYEKTHTLDQSMDFLLGFLKERNISYETFINRLSEDKNVTNVDALNINQDNFFHDHIIFRENIADKVKRGLSVEVVDSCCCAFGKELKRLEGSSFTSHRGWHTLHQAHDSVHLHMKDYVQKSKDGASSLELDRLLETVHSDTKIIFENLRDVINHAS